MANHQDAVREILKRFKTTQKDHKKGRDRIRKKRFFKHNLLYPALFGSIAGFSFNFIAFQDARTWKLILIHVAHFFVLLFLLILFWFPMWVSVITEKKQKELSDLRRLVLLLIRDGILFFMILAIFPFQLIHVGMPQVKSSVLLVVFILIFIGLLLVDIKMSIIYISGKGLKAGGQFRASEGAMVGLKQAVFYFVFLFILMTFEAWFTAVSMQARVPLSEMPKMLTESPLFYFQRYITRTVSPEEEYSTFLQPYQVLLEKIDRPTASQYWPHQEGGLGHKYPIASLDSEAGTRMLAKLETWLCILLLTSFLILALGGFNSRIMATVLPVAVLQPEKVHLGIGEIIVKSHVYARNFFDHLRQEHAFSVLGGFTGTFIYLGVPILLYSAGQYEALAASLNEDTIFFAGALIAAWIGPVVLSLYKIDDTYGIHFNRSIARMIMDISDHTVYIGYGDQGKRIVDRDVRRSFALDREHNIDELVTPDLVVARVFLSALVIDASDRDFVYAAENDLLGRYGVIAVEQVGGARLRELPKVSDVYRVGEEPDEDQAIWQYSEPKRVLVLAVQGSIEQPYVAARANLERARLLISTIPGHRDVNVAFNLIAHDKIKAILCVTRSDQMAYLTYRASVRPVVLIYPTAMQGAAMGRRLWAAVQNASAYAAPLPDAGGERPRIYLIGKDKSLFYLLENLWISLQESEDTKSQWFRQHVIGVQFLGPDLQPEELEAGYPSIMLHEHQPGASSEKDTPAHEKSERRDANILKCMINLQFGSGRRYPVTEEKMYLDYPLYIIPGEFIGLVRELFEKAWPDIILIHTSDSEWSQRLIMLIMRILERKLTDGVLKEARRDLPLLIMTLASASSAEKAVIGDMSRYYQKMARAYNDRLARLHVYPTLSVWDRSQARLLGESIIDLKQDVDECIAGVQKSLFEGVPGARGKKPEVRAEFMEINTCGPNLPGSLGSLTARLAGLKFQEPDTSEEMLLPSFQNLRISDLDLAGQAGVCTGFALLQSYKPDTEYEIGETRRKDAFVRVFATDGNKYTGQEHEKQQQKHRPGAERPNVPGAIQFIAGLKRTETHPDVEENMHCIPVERFRRILFDAESGTKPGPCACPGINTCPVGTYQDYILASNNIDEKQSDQQAYLRDAANYYCIEEFPSSLRDFDPNRSRPAARMMVCYYSPSDIPGKLAYVLNSLLLRKLTGTRKGYLVGSGENQQEYVLNIQYMNDMTCHNRRFTFNRIFGYWQKRENAGDHRPVKPPANIQLVEIMPIGTPESAWKWLDYADRLFRFLNDISTRQEKAYSLIWFDERKQRYDSASIDEEVRQRHWPAAILIYYKTPIEEIKKRTAERVGDYQLCNICGLQGKAWCCERFRPWDYEEGWGWQSVYGASSENKGFPLPGKP